MTPRLKTILKWGGIAVGIVIVILVVVSLTTGKSQPKQSTGGLVSTKTGSSPLNTTSSGTGSPVSREGQIVSLLRSLSTIRLEGTVFTNPAFAILQDISIILPRVTEQGRPNPFAPLGISSPVAEEGTDGGAGEVAEETQ